MVIFKDYKHSSERAIQCFDACMEKLKHVLDKRKVAIKSLIVYSDNAGCDKKNRFMMDFFTTYGIPIRYFQRPADHNKWIFDSEGGLFKRCYLKAALNKFNIELQWVADDIRNKNADKHLKIIKRFMNCSPNTDWHNTTLTKKSITICRECIWVTNISTNKKNKLRSVKYSLPNTMSNYCFFTAGKHKMVYRHLPCFCVE